MSKAFTIDGDERFQAFVINRKIPFTVMLERAGYEGYSYEGKCFCPFHDNFDSPAGKIYQDKKGDTLWCFSEQKRYYPSDVLKRNLMKGKTVTSIFTNLWRKLDESEKERLIEAYDKPIDIIPENWIQNREKLYLFKKGVTSIEQHLYLLRECLK